MWRLFLLQNLLKKRQLACIISLLAWQHDDNKNLDSPYFADNLNTPDNMSKNTHTKLFKLQFSGASGNKLQTAGRLSSLCRLKFYMVIYCRIRIRLLIAIQVGNIFVLCRVLLKFFFGTHFISSSFTILIFRIRLISAINSCLRGRSRNLSQFVKNDE